MSRTRGVTYRCRLRVVDRTLRLESVERAFIHGHVRYYDDEFKEYTPRKTSASRKWVEVGTVTRTRSTEVYDSNSDSHATNISRSRLVAKTSIAASISRRSVERRISQKDFDWMSESCVAIR